MIDKDTVWEAIQKLQDDLKRAEEVLRNIADTDRWSYPTGNESYGQHYAREYFKAKGE